MLAFATLAAIAASATVAADTDGIGFYKALAHQILPYKVRQGPAALNVTVDVPAPGGRALQSSSCSLFSECSSCATQSACVWCSGSASSTVGNCISYATTSCTSSQTTYTFASSCPSSSVTCGSIGSCSSCNSQSSCTWCAYSSGGGGYCRSNSGFCPSGSSTTYSCSATTNCGLYSGSCSTCNAQSACWWCESGGSGYCNYGSSCPTGSLGSCSSSGGGSSGGSSSGGSSFSGFTVGSGYPVSKPPAVPAGGTAGIALGMSAIIIGITAWQVCIAMAAGIPPGTKPAATGPAAMVVNNPLSNNGVVTTVTTTGPAAAGGVVMGSHGGFLAALSNNIAVRRAIYSGAATAAFFNIVFLMVAAFAVWYSYNLTTGSGGVTGGVYIYLHTVAVCGGTGGIFDCFAASLRDGSFAAGIAFCFFAAFFSLLAFVVWVVLANNAAATLTRSPHCCCSCFSSDGLVFSFSLVSFLLSLLGMIIPGARFGKLIADMKAVGVVAPYAPSSGPGMGAVAVILNAALLVMTIFLWRVAPNRVPNNAHAGSIVGGAQTTVVMLPAMGHMGMGMHHMQPQGMTVSTGGAGGTTVMMTPGSPGMGMAQPMMAAGSPYPAGMYSPQQQMHAQYHPQAASPQPLAVQKLASAADASHSFAPQAVGGAASHPGIPAGWDVKQDPASGAFYYVNLATGASQWEPPTAKAM